MQRFLEAEYPVNFSLLIGVGELCPLDFALYRIRS
jgi:hypothetical protein